MNEGSEGVGRSQDSTTSVTNNNNSNNPVNINNDSSDFGNPTASAGQFAGQSEHTDLEDSLGGGNTSENDTDGGSSKAALREQDRFLPIANVARIMKLSIPKSGKIAKDAKECVQECVSEFVSFITSEASDRCHQEKRKTINGEDILYAMQTLGFDNYVPPLKLYLSKFREAQKGDKTLGGGPVGSITISRHEIGDIGVSTPLVVNATTSGTTTIASGNVTNDLIGQPSVTSVVEGNGHVPSSDQTEDSLNHDLHDYMFSVNPH